MASCREFQKLGRCKYGAKCKFSHGDDVIPPNKRSHRPAAEATTEEKDFREWTYMIPRQNSTSHRPVDMKTFFENGHNLVEALDIGMRQRVIQKLGEETGLQMIKGLVDRVSQSHGAAAITIFKDCTLPFFRIISNQGVLSSLLLENQVATIYNFLYGPSGNRGLSLFQPTADALKSLIQVQGVNEREISIAGISSTLAVLDRMIELNQNAQVVEGFTTIAKTMSEYIPDNLMTVNVQQSLTRIKRRLQIGSSLPLASSQLKPQSTIIPVFELPVDLPGRLSPNGPRHDNDHANIRDIKILPTTQEIASIRQEYLPTVGSTQHHLSGLPGLLDRQFRLLHEDTVGPLKDAAREEVARLSNNAIHNIQSSQRQGVRKSIYHNFRFSGIRLDRRRGFQVTAEFDQPPQVRSKTVKNRKEWWESSKLLQIDSLVCFVSAAGTVIFFSVADPILSRRKEKDEDKTERKEKYDEQANTTSLFIHPQTASVTLCLAEYKEEDVAWIAKTLASNAKARQSLVEFPGILLPSFQPTLKALQAMSKSLNLPFPEIIAPEPDTTITLKPPAYATRGFSFKLDDLAGEPLTLTPGKAFDFHALKNSKCTLDDTQQNAVIQALSTELALVQGPPGTGKSFTGVKIIQILLSNKRAAKLGPIVCVCYTNHALDQLLEHLVKDGVRQIIRLGSRSKSEILQSVTINSVRKNIVPSKHEKASKWDCNRAIDEVVKEVEALLPSLNNPTSWINVRDYLQENHHRHFQQLFGKEVDENGYREVKGRRFRAVESWLQNAPKNRASNRPIGQLKSMSLHDLSKTERLALHKHWISQHTAELTTKLIRYIESYHEAKSDLDKCHSELDLRCLQEAQIIGVTTSGLARNLNLLQRTGAKVMLCEEAGEVLEAHTLTALLPGIEHAILIGDHEQLRPQINNYELQHDNPRGEKYSLDISLFERLVRPKPGAPQVPLSSLKTQRRMHPSISELVRVPIYPDLEDHPTVAEYPEIDGMRKRLFWLNHQEKEDQRTDQMASLSRSNAFEIEMVAALVSHLVRQGVYAPNDIAVLTPYLGQLQKIKKRLANSFEIVIGDRDLDDLAAQGLLDDIAAESSADTLGPKKVQRTTLLNSLRIASVDNFQGDEAKVIVISLVRCNDNRQCGFLKTSNRINVLLSRARHGMYIIGNADTARPVKMWDKVLTILERDDNIGKTLALCCPRHKDTSIEVSTPDDFVRFAPEGGCSEKCKERLPCGHACINRCHSGPLHNAVRCLERCPRTKKGCEHECPKVCGDRCDEKCQVKVPDIQLPCGHISNGIKCHQAQQPKTYDCHTKVQQEMKACGHTIAVKCRQLPLKIDHPCSAQCTDILPCGHECTRLCMSCNTAVEGKITSKNHHTCQTKCARPYSTCRHSCTSNCHGEVPCPPCESRCEVSCSHSKCNKLCKEPCAPCAEACSWSCSHRGRCPLPCAIPCDILPCPERCAEILECGHRCPSICGETCPSSRSCQICCSESVREMVVDYIMQSTYAEIDLDETPCIVPVCGHILTLESMDGHMSMGDFYTKDDQDVIIGLKNTAEPFSASGMKSCPTCRAPLRSLNRYNRISRRALIDESTKKFIVWANSSFLPLVTKMQELELRLSKAPTQKLGDQSTTVIASKKTIKLEGSSDEHFALVRNHLGVATVQLALSNLRQDIRRFLRLVDEREQPFSRIYDLAQDARRHRGVNATFESRVDVLQTRHRLLTTALLIRCDYTVLVTFLEARENGGLEKPQLDLSKCRRECELLIADAESSKQPASEVEGHLYWARLTGLERRFPLATSPPDIITQLLTEGRQHLHTARDLCTTYPGQTKGQSSEITDVEKMLRDATFYVPVSNAEKAAVYAAMAKDFRGTGHWYYCVNGHPFTIGDCGMPMVTSVCPQCKAPVGGRDHVAVEGVRAATDLEREFGGLSI